MALAPLCGLGSLRVPDVEALDVKLKSFVGGTADTFHIELFSANGLLAGVARFVVGRTTPEARNAVVRKITLSELAADY